MERIPILKLENFLIISVQTDIHDKVIQVLQVDILNAIIETHARGVLIDVSAIDIMDSFMARTLRDAAIMAGLVGSKVVVTGIQPAVAITLIDLGLRMDHVHTANNLDHGFELLKELLKEEGPGEK